MAFIALQLVASSGFAARNLAPELPGTDSRYASGTPTRAEPSGPWWTSFEDRELDALVDEALQANHQLAVAVARAQQAQAVSVQSVSPLLPSASFDVGLNASPSSSAAFQVPPQLTEALDELTALGDQFGQFTGEDDSEDEDAEAPDVTWGGSALVQLGLNIDLGRSAANLRASQLDAAAARGDRDGVAHVITQQVCSAWFDLRAARARVAVIEEQVRTNESVLELTQMRYEAGDSRGLDVLQQQQQLAMTRALLPRAQQQQRVFEVQLAVLLGRDPSAPGFAEVAAPEEGRALPDLPPQPGLGTPADLLETRAEVVAARFRYDAARARVFASALSFAPSFRLSANAGWSLRWYDEWSEQETWGFGAAVSVPIFGGLQRHGALRQATAARAAASREYSRAALVARAEVESALARETTGVDRLAALGDQLRAAGLAYDESTRQYAAGVVNYLTVLTSLASLQSVQLEHLQARRDVLAARIDLHAALGASGPGRAAATEVQP